MKNKLKLVLNCERTCHEALPEFMCTHTIGICRENWKDIKFIILPFQKHWHAIVILIANPSHHPFDRESYVSDDELTSAMVRQSENKHNAEYIMLMS